jgi:transcriptional regulator with XRE-family HTH domain
MITAAQCRAARGLLDWTQFQLAEASSFGVVAIRKFEGGARARSSTIEMLQRALEAGGVVFVDENGEGPGVRLKKGFVAAPPVAGWRMSGRADIEDDP